MKVGGRDFNQDKRDVELAMRGETPEDLRKYAVLVNGEAFPPKQVLATVTGWGRDTFTTMEAQRVLKRLGFECKETIPTSDGRLGWVRFQGKPESIHEMGAPGTHRAKVMEENIEDLEDRVKRLEAAHAMAAEAIAGLSAKVKALEER